MDLQRYVEKWNRDKHNNFAVACYDMNSLSELQESHTPNDADESDMRTWGITAEEWSDALEAALNEALNDCS